jgi:hypothetical protein
VRRSVGSWATAGNARAWPVCASFSAPACARRPCTRLRRPCAAPAPSLRPPCTQVGENADTLAALPRIWAHSLGGQRTAGERTTSRPNTQPGLPSKDYLWKLPRSGPSPRRSAARWRSTCSPRFVEETADTLVRENADTLAALPRVWAHSLGRQRTAGERTTSRPKHSTRPALEGPPVEATSLGAQPASLRRALALHVFTETLYMPTVALSDTVVQCCGSTL